MAKIKSRPWLKYLGLAVALLLGITAIVTATGAIYVSLISTQIDNRIEQLRSARSSKFYALYPALKPGQRFPLKSLETFLADAGYAKKSSARQLTPGSYAWETQQDPTWVLSLYRPSYSGAGYPLEKRMVRVLWEKTPEGLTLDEIIDARTQSQKEQFEHLPKQLGYFFAGRLRSQHSVPLSEIPVSARLAVMAIEDVHFLEHIGVSLRGTLRALWTDLIAMKWVQGGSTITQQLMKNLFFSREKVLSRKFKEALYAFVAEARHSKEDLLEAYLNEVYLGQWNTHEIHGVSEAARYYFNHSIFDVTLAESATLAAMIQAPNALNPRRVPETVIKRRNLVLKQMLEAGFILQSEYERSIAKPLGVVPPSRSLDDAAYFMDLVMHTVPHSTQEKLDTDALTIYVTLNPYLQTAASNVLSSHLQRLENRYRTLLDKKELGATLQGALLSINVSDCSVLALQGGRSFREAPFNRVLQGKRQAGSLFKPFVYLTAFSDPPDKMNVSANMELDDSPFEWRYDKQVWIPNNYDEKFRGPVPLREALQKSINIPTARLAQMVGIGPIVDNLVRAGIHSTLPKVPSISLGSAEVTPMELGDAYTTVARLGQRCVLRSYLKIFDENRNLISENKTVTKEKLDPDATRKTVELLKGVFTHGTARSALASGLELGNFAGKTGTTNDFKDAWFVGFSPEILTLVWVGYDAQDTVDFPGSVAALPIWVNFMKEARPFYGDEDF